MDEVAPSGELAVEKDHAGKIQRPLWGSRAGTPNSGVGGAASQAPLPKATAKSKRRGSLRYGGDVKGGAEKPGGT